MDADRLNKWLTLIANIGVISGILFLGLEIQQSNRIAVASTEIDVRNAFAGINESIYSDAEMSELILRISDENADTTPVEEFRLYVFVVRLTNTWLGIETAFENGMVPPETYGVIENDMESFMRDFPGTRPLFRRVFDTYPALLDTDVYQTMERLLATYGDN